MKLCLATATHNFKGGGLLILFRLNWDQRFANFDDQTHISFPMIVIWLNGLKTSIDVLSDLRVEMILFISP